MTARGTWKTCERQIARALGTDRNPLSGSNAAHSMSDTLHKDLYIEIKTRKKLPFRETFVDTIRKAFIEGKIPVTVYHELNQKREDDMVLLRFEDFRKMWFAYIGNI